MKPVDLIPPFPKVERKIVIHDRVWYLPEADLSQNRFEFPGWNHPSFFGNENPVCVEYCSGNGAWIAAQALAHPEINWLAVEKKFMRVRKIWSKIKNLKLNNLMIIFGEAFSATSCYFPTACASDIYINFPDPWPKKKHAKHRLVKPAFVQELTRIMKMDKMLTFVTDDPVFSDAATKIILSNSNLHPYYPAPYFSTDENNYGSSYFEELWRSKGKIIRYHRFIRK